MKKKGHKKNEMNNYLHNNILEYFMLFLNRNHL